MNITFDHISLSVDSPERMKDFLIELLDLESRFRPNLPFEGYFLYAGEDSIIHIFGRKQKNEQQLSREPVDLMRTGVVHHVSFFSDNYEDVMNRIEKLNLKYSMSNVPGTKTKQIFVQAPESLIIEIQAIPD